MPATETQSDLQSYLTGRFEGLRARHREGAPSPQIIAGLTGLVDDVIGRASLIAFGDEATRSAADAPPWALVALGGYGRRELNPYSDIDVMVLTTPEARERISAPAARFFQLLWDLRYHLGHSLRTVEDCVELAATDLTAQTALLESRYLLGNPVLYASCRERLAAIFRVKRFLPAKREERRQEFERHGATTSLLEPNVKKSPGGLRDLHAVKWISLAIHRTADWQALVRDALLTPSEADLLQRHQSILWQIRNDLHFHAGRASDVLSFDEQQRLAEIFGYRNERPLLAVEQFMQCYYRITMEIHDICDRLFERVIPEPWTVRLAAKLLPRKHGHFLLTDRTITLLPDSREVAATTPTVVMELFYQAHIQNLRVTDEARRIASSAVEQFSPEAWHGSEVGRLFLSILAAPGWDASTRSGNIAETLRVMHRVRLLGRLLPAFDHVTSLMQFNRYHHYTVDEHCIRAVGYAEQLFSLEEYLGVIYRGIKRKELLHLALLLHDVGKGYEGDHSERGVELAEEAARWLQLTADDLQLVSLLIREHLLMSNIAFRRDLSDEKIVLRFARRVAQPETLTMLYILTVADIQAVGPETWTSWKAELMKELFDKTMEILAGSRMISAEDERIRLAKAAAETYAEKFFEAPWLHKQCAAMPARYWLTTPPEQVVDHLAGFKQLTPNEVVVTTRAQPDRGTFSYTVFTQDTLIPGIFSKIAGVLAAKGVQILAAQVFTRHDGTIVDTFEVLDPDYSGSPPPRRIEAVSAAIREVLKGVVTIDALFARSRRVETDRRHLVRLPTQVEVDNESSDDYTIIDIFADDRQGLLFVIANALFEAGLSIYSAKISTRLDQIADVFYVKTLEGAKLTDPERIADVKRRLQAAVTAHLNQLM